MSYATEATRVEGGGGYGNLGGANKNETAYANAADSVPLENYPAGQPGYR